MKWFALLAVVVVCGCSGDDEKSTDLGISDQALDQATSDLQDLAPPEQSLDQQPTPDVTRCVPGALEFEEGWANVTFARFSSPTTVMYTVEHTGSQHVDYRLYEDSICGGQRRLVTDLVDRAYFALDADGHPVFFHGGESEPSQLVRWDGTQIVPLPPDCNAGSTAEAMDIVGSRALLNYSGGFNLARLFDLNETTCEGYISGGDRVSHNHSARLSPDGSKVLFNYLPDAYCDPEANDFMLYDIASEQAERIAFAPDDQPSPECAEAGPYAFYPDGAHVLIGMHSSVILELDLTTQTSRRLELDLPAFSFDVTWVEVAPDSQTALVVFPPGLTVFSLAEGS